MKLSMIVAMAQNRVIGRGNDLPWRLPADLKYFKSTTMGKPLIMGRNTHESIGRALPGRANIVVTRNKALKFEGCEVVGSLADAIERASSACATSGSDEAFIIGGAQLYQQAIEVAERLYLTQVQAQVDGDTWFPEFDRSQWVLLQQTDFLADDANTYDYSFLLLERRKREQHEDQAFSDILPAGSKITRAH